MSSEELVEGGIYRIIVAKFGAQPDLLTRYERKGVTLLPPSEAPVPEQEVIRRFSTSSIICRSPPLLVANLPW